MTWLGLFHLTPANYVYIYTVAGKKEGSSNLIICETVLL